MVHLEDIHSLTEFQRNTKGNRSGGRGLCCDGQVFFSLSVTREE